MKARANEAGIVGMLTTRAVLKLRALIRDSSASSFASTTGEEWGQ